MIYWDGEIHRLGWSWGWAGLVGLVVSGCVAGASPSTAMGHYDGWISVLRGSSLSLEPSPLVDPITVEIYRLDKQCEYFVTEPHVVNRGTGLADTVRWLLQTSPVPHLDLTDYRLRMDPDQGRVTLDLRLSATSLRQLQSLSLCEQQALLGSVRQTLLNHPDWGIREVRFTQRGDPLLP